MVGALLGTGGFAKVFSVTNSRTGEASADKVIEKKLFKEKAPKSFWHSDH